MDVGTLFLNATVLSGTILVKAEYQIGTRYLKILKMKGLGLDRGKTNLIRTSLVKSNAFILILLL